MKEIKPRARDTDAVLSSNINSYNSTDDNQAFIGKGLFPIVEKGYDVREADAYIAFLLSEYNKSMERIAVLEQAQSQERGMAQKLAEDSVATSQGAQDEQQDSQEAELNELRDRLKQMSDENALAAEREQELKNEVERLQQEYNLLEQKKCDTGEKNSPTVEHTAKIIAEILIQARDGGEKILAKANADADTILSNAKSKAASFESEAKEKVVRAREVFEESQRKIEESQQRIQEAYSFLQNFPEEFSI